MMKTKHLRESSFQTSLEDENFDSIAMDCAITQDTTLTETDIQDDSLLQKKNVGLSNIDHKHTFAL